MAGRKTKIERNCLQCNAIIMVNPCRERTNKFCSKECFDLHQKKRVTLVCLGCKKDFQVRPFAVKDRKFCSSKCAGKNKVHPKKTGIYKSCTICSKEMYVQPCQIDTKKFCSIECQTKGKITHGLCTDRKSYRKYNNQKQRISRGSKNYRQIRKVILFDRKNTCEICGYNEHSFCMDIHHIDEDPRNNSLDNLSLLCAMCHRKLHKGFVTLKEENVSCV